MSRAGVLLFVLSASLAVPGYSGTFLLHEPIPTDTPDAVTHPLGYDGTGGIITIGVCIDPASTYASALVAPLTKAVNTLNGLVATTGTYVAVSAEVPSGHADAESVLLHEISHCVGLHHVNLGSLLSPLQQIFFGNATFSVQGADAEYSFVVIGGDNIWGSADDGRGDDVNLNWFRQTTNDPFMLPVGPPPAYDQTSYTRNLASLPSGHSYSTSGGPAVASHLGYANTRAVMYAATAVGAEVRSLSHDDVATFRYAMSGLNETEGDADDYVFMLQVVPFPCDIPIRFLPLGQTVGGLCRSNNVGPLEGTLDHYVVAPVMIELNSDFQWFFGPAPDLAITKSDGDISVSAGDDIVYALEVSNIGALDTGGVEIEEIVSDSTTFNAMASDPGWSCTDIIPGSRCILSVGTLVAGGPAVQATFVVTVDDPLPGGVEEIANLARVSDDENSGPDPSTGNNFAQTSTPVVSNDVFCDGFESGDTTEWSTAVPGV